MIYKVISWRLVSIVLTYLVTYLYTGDLKSATGFTILLHIVLTLGNYCFEILWKKHVDSSG